MRTMTGSKPSEVETSSNTWCNYPLGRASKGSLDFGSEANASSASSISSAGSASFFSAGLSLFFCSFSFFFSFLAIKKNISGL